jgi:hypothetical protein
VSVAPEKKLVFLKYNSRILHGLQNENKYGVIWVHKIRNKDCLEHNADSETIAHVHKKENSEI